MEINADHVKKIQTAYKRKQLVKKLMMMAADTRICPACGGDLFLKHSRYPNSRCEDCGFIYYPDSE